MALEELESYVVLYIIGQVQGDLKGVTDSRDTSIM
jgi:hypothetical protein